MDQEGGQLFVQLAFGIRCWGVLVGREPGTDAH